MSESQRHLQTIQVRTLVKWPNTWVVRRRVFENIGLIWWGTLNPSWPPPLSAPRWRPPPRSCICRSPGSSPGSSRCQRWPWTTGRPCWRRRPSRPAARWDSRGWFPANREQASVEILHTSRYDSLQRGSLESYLHCSWLELLGKRRSDLEILLLLFGFMFGHGRV